MNKTSGLAHRILHDDPILFPWGYSIGDHISLYPIAFSARARYLNSSSFNLSADQELCKVVCKKYVLGYPHRLSDGTVSRGIGWLPYHAFPRNASAVWVDDSFMGTALVTHSLSFLPDASTYASYAGAQLLGMLARLQDPGTNLLHHGYDGARDVRSCCTWGRGNGWMLMALTDYLLAAPSNTSQYQDVLKQYRLLALAVAAFQDTASGRWYNVVNETATGLETSSSAFFTYAFIHGLEQHWLPTAPFEDVVRRAVAGLAAQVAVDGTIGGVVGESGIKMDRRGYDVASSTLPYAGAAPGLGAVLRALAAAARYSRGVSLAYV